MIFYDSNRISHFLPTLERMVQDPSIAVRSCAAGTLIEVLRHDQELAVCLFLRLCETEDVLLKTNFVERFLFYALRSHFVTLKPIVERMVASEIPEVATAGARQISIASLTLEEALPLARLCLSGTEAQRVGATEAFAANLRIPRFRSSCEEALIQLFNDPDEKVLHKSAKCFDGFEGESLGEYVELILAFVQSPAFVVNYSYLIRALERTTTKLPDITCLVCERFLDIMSSSSINVRARSVAEVDKVNRLLIRVYSQSTNNALQVRCLNLIDHMAQMGIYGLDKALALYDR